MALEGTLEPRKIRIHNAERLFYEWHDVRMENRGARAEKAGYTPEFAGNLAALCREFFEENRPFTIVPAADDLCAKCSGEIREAKCELADPDSEARGAAAVFGKDVVVGGTYTPLDMTERALPYVRREIERISKIEEKYRDNWLLETQRKRLIGLEAAYARLLQCAESKGESR
ncbi:MAG TPA: hypothetical protein HA362_04640 [Nanoarchaeota archaeon]|nr:hypothetical protein [Nanoarchaeota archaeon]